MSRGKVSLKCCLWDFDKCNDNNVQTSIPSALVDLQKVINNHSKVFGEMPKGLPLVRDHDHAIHLHPGSVPPKIRPYRYPHEKRVRLTVWLKKC